MRDVICGRPRFDFFLCFVKSYLTSGLTGSIFFKPSSMWMTQTSFFDVWKFRSCVNIDRVLFYTNMGKHLWRCLKILLAFLNWGGGYILDRRFPPTIFELFSPLTFHQGATFWRANRCLSVNFTNIFWAAFFVPKFHVQLFCTYVKFRFILFRTKKIGVQADLKMLVKLTLIVIYQFRIKETKFCHLRQLISTSLSTHFLRCSGLSVCLMKFCTISGVNPTKLWFLHFSDFHC